MKVWVKLLIGSVLGITIGFLLPDSERIFSILMWLEKLAINIGRYAVIPVLVFSLTVAVYELRMDEQFWPMVLKNFLLIIAVSIFVIFSGIIVTSIFTPSRIPIESFEQTEIISLNVRDNVMELFPSNMLSVLTGGGIYLFPVCIFAFFLGMGLNYDRNYSKPVISLVDSLSRIFYHVASFFSEILGFILIVLASFWAVRFNGLLQAKVYKDLIVMLGVFSVVLCFVILPLFLLFLKPRVNPWRVLYGFLGPALTAFFSGDVNFTIPVLQRHSKENFGIRRRSSALSMSLFATFCRCGSAMVAAVAFIVIIKSISYIRISSIELFTIGLYALAISFVLARHPGEGAYIALATLCLIYGGGQYEAYYLILKPMAFYLIAIGTFIDIMLNAFGTYVLAKTNGFIEEKNLVHFI
ncbi:MAG: cation:dicarboxylase symporter family transporter [Treponema sp.]|nr:cation:dicarboxylase symporter family transporter [Treponema sp.]